MISGCMMQVVIRHTTFEIEHEKPPASAVRLMNSDHIEHERSSERKTVMELTSQKMRRLAPELDPLRLGTGWKPEDLEK